MFLLKWQTGVRQRRKHPLFLSFLLCWSEYLWSRARTLKKWLQCSQQRHWSLNLLLTLLPNTLAVIVCTRLTSEGQVECWLCSHVNFPLHPQQQPCSTLLMKTIRTSAGTNGCIEKTEQWRAMERYDGNVWRSVPYNFALILNIDYRFSTVFFNCNIRSWQRSGAQIKYKHLFETAAWFNNEKMPSHLSVFHTSNPKVSLSSWCLKAFPTNAVLTALRFWPH